MLRLKLHGALVLAALVALGCPKPADKLTSPQQASSEPEIGIYPLRLVPSTPEADKAGALELRADGSLWSEKGDEVAKIEGNKIIGVSAPFQGKELIVLNAGGVIKMPVAEAEREGAPVQASVTLTPEGQVKITNCYQKEGAECRIAIGDDGAISLSRPDGTPEVAPFKFESVSAQSKPTAALIVALIILAVPPTVSQGPTESSVPPAVKP